MKYLESPQAAQIATKDAFALRNAVQARLVGSRTKLPSSAPKCCTRRIRPMPGMRVIKVVRQVRGADEQAELCKVVAAQRKAAAEAKAAAEKVKAAEKAKKDKRAEKQRAERKRAEASGDRPVKVALPAVVKKVGQRAKDDEMAWMLCCEPADLRLNFSTGYLETHHPGHAARLADVAAKQAAREAAALASSAAAASNPAAEKGKCGAVSASSEPKAMQAEATPTRAWITEVLVAHDELRACHGVTTPIQWSSECFLKARAGLRDFEGRTAAQRTQPQQTGPGGFDVSMSGVAQGLLGCTGPMIYNSTPTHRLGGDGQRWWSAKHRIRYFYAYGGATGWHNMLCCSHVGAAVSDCGCGFHLFYMGPFACKPTKAGEDMQSRRAIVTLEQKLAARGEQFHCGCLMSASVMMKAWKKLTSQVRISDVKAVKATSQDNYYRATPCDAVRRRATPCDAPALAKLAFVYVPTKLKAQYQ